MGTIEWMSPGEPLGDASTQVYSHGLTAKRLLQYAVVRLACSLAPLAKTYPAATENLCCAISPWLYWQ
jgi:hypothetical protein